MEESLKAYYHVSNGQLLFHLQTQRNLGRESNRLSSVLYLTGNL